MVVAVVVSIGVEPVTWRGFIFTHEFGGADIAELAHDQTAVGHCHVESVTLVVHLGRFRSLFGSFLTLALPVDRNVSIVVGLFIVGEEPRSLIMTAVADPRAGALNTVG